MVLFDKHYVLFPLRNYKKTIDEVPFGPSRV
jgi:hypothetical protein